MKKVINIIGFIACVLILLGGLIEYRFLKLQEKARKEAQSEREFLFEVSSNWDLYTLEILLGKQVVEQDRDRYQELIGIGSELGKFRECELAAIAYATDDLRHGSLKYTDVECQFEYGRANVIIGTPNNGEPHEIRYFGLR